MAKRKGRHPSEALTGPFVHEVKAVGFYADGNGLYLRVDRTGSKRWILRTVVRGKRRDIGLGGFSSVSLIEARLKARVLRKIARKWGPVRSPWQCCLVIPPRISQAIEAAIEHLKAALQGARKVPRRASSTTSVAALNAAEAAVRARTEFKKPVPGMA